jgi:uncharacterized protein (DUF302 family)
MQSGFSVGETIARLEAQIKARGMTLLARIDHAAGAQSVGMPLRPTEVLIFGNPKAGTPLMQASQTIGIDLPLKALVYEDEGGKVWLAYNDPAWLAARHALVDAAPANITAMTNALRAAADEATHA